MDNRDDQQTQKPTKIYYTIKKAAEIKQIPYWKLLRSCNTGVIPTYTLGDSRRYVTLDDIDAALQKSWGDVQ